MSYSPPAWDDVDFGGTGVTASSPTFYAVDFTTPPATSCRIGAAVSEFIGGIESSYQLATLAGSISAQGGIEASCQLATLSGIPAAITGDLVAECAFFTTIGGTASARGLCPTIVGAACTIAGIAYPSGVMVAAPVAVATLAGSIGASGLLGADVVPTVVSLGAHDAAATGAMAMLPGTTVTIGGLVGATGNMKAWDWTNRLSMSGEILVAGIMSVGAGASPQLIRASFGGRARAVGNMVV